jgi:preprotein translocase subunit SecA
MGILPALSKSILLLTPHAASHKKKVKTIIKMRITFAREYARRVKQRMVQTILNALFGTKGERDIKRMRPIIERITDLEYAMKELDDTALAAKTQEFRERLHKMLGCAPSELVLTGDHALKDRKRLLFALDSLLPEAFAVVRETAWRALRQRPYDVQLIGGIVLHQGKISEMKTGEGKTLTSTLPVYLNALAGLGVHVVTVNDYLARRDAEWMRPIFSFLGLSVGYILTNMHPRERQASYACDITYGTNNEFGFDYLRDNMVHLPNLRVQRNYYFCIVDEVDSILIDEARTPLIISGAAEESTKKYYEIQKVIPRLKRGFTFGQNIDRKIDALTDEKTELHTRLDAGEARGGEDKLNERIEEIKNEVRELNREKQLAGMHKKLNVPADEGDYIVEESDRTAYLTPIGIKKVEGLLGIDNLYGNTNIAIVHHLEQALKANTIFHLDVDYVVKDGEVIIVDEFTGRLMPGRRYSDGLHQALEAKEGVTVARENQTLATITFQNYFRMYTKLSGMTGTAETEAEEFRKIYGLDVVVIPTNRPLMRADFPDRIFRTEDEKISAIVNEIAELNDKGQPVLVGTISVEKSERLSRILRGRGIPHNVLNAKFHELEADIVAQAGQYGRVTIATNMAGRGTDIILGGNPELQGRKFIENLLKSLGRKAEPDAIREFVSLVLLDKRDTLKTFYEAESAFDEGIADKLRLLKRECQAGQKAVLEKGGLFILGTERHEARRIDNQLRGRSGRQGDMGCSRFYISMEDDLMRLFGGERLKNTMQRLGMREGEEIEHPLISRAIANAQKRVELRNFEVRKHLLKYDEVMNEQRTYIYSLRNRILGREDVSDIVRDMVNNTVDVHIEECKEGGNDFTQETIMSVQRWVEGEIRIPVDIPEDTDMVKIDQETFASSLKAAFQALLSAREKHMGSANMRVLEKLILLATIDSRWKDHLYEMDGLKEGINWMVYAERDPVTEYKLRGMRIFNSMLAGIDSQVTTLLFHAEITNPSVPNTDFNQYAEGRSSHDAFGQFGAPAPSGQAVQAQAAGARRPAPATVPRGEQIVRTSAKVGRNDPCPCGSGRKYKQCHGKGK